MNTHECELALTDNKNVDSARTSKIFFFQKLLKIFLIQYIKANPL
jgi:hypothetical protein